MRAGRSGAQRARGPERQVRQGRLSNTCWVHGHDAGAVDWFPGRLRRREDRAGADRVNADPWRDLDDWARRSAKPSKQEYRDAWEDFGRQPGTRLRWVRTDALRNELRTAGQTVVTVRWGWKPRAVTASGRVFTRRWVPGSWRD